MVNIHKIFYLQNKLKKTHFRLTQKTLKFIKHNYKKTIHKKDDPNIFISLIQDYYLEKRAKEALILQKILEKIKTKNYIKSSKMNTEVFCLLSMVWGTQQKGYFSTLHLETLEPSIKEQLVKYFQFVEKELTIYLLTSSQILNVTQLLEKNCLENISKKVQTLKYSNNFNLWILRKNLNLAFSLENHKIDVETKHLFLTVQLILIQHTLNAKTYSEIFYFRDLLTDFLFLSKLAT